MWQTLKNFFNSNDLAPEADPELVERLIDLAGPNIRMARQYQQRLASYAAWAQGHALDLAAHLPQPLPVSTESWRKHRILQLVFATPDRMEEIVGNDAGLQEWFAAWPLADSACVALLADCEVRTRFGMSDDNGVLRQDVEQQVLQLSGHELGRVAPTHEALVNLGSLRILDTVARLARGTIAGFEQEKAGVEDELNNARTMLRLKPPEEQEACRERIRILTDEMQRCVANLTPDAQCEALITELAATPERVRLRKESLLLDRMGVAGTADGEPVDLYEIELDRPSGVIHKLLVPLEVPRSLMKPPAVGPLFNPDTLI